MFSRALLSRSTTRFVGVAQPSINAFAGAKRFLSDDLRGRIDKAINSHDVLVFMKGSKEAPQCGFSRAVVQLLNSHGVKYSTVNVLADESVRNGIKEYSSWPTIPQVYVKGEFVGGCDILVKMDKDGDLSKLLLEKGLLKQDGSAGI
ncbi:hypothetical protein HDU81_008084 [Chytriomyces hyalinus]|nr:hypothetical protein HDU81_008084 [Chytriomyces hyalinus]